MSSVTLACADLQVVIDAEAGMLCHSLRHKGQEILTQRATVEQYAATGRSTGIPLLYPWANRLSAFEYAAAGQAVTIARDDPRLHLDPNGLPIHGLRTGATGWRVNRPHAVARLDWAHPELLEAFPFPHRLTVEYALSKEALTVTTTVEATGACAVPIAFGWHPWLTLPGVERADWQVDLPVRSRAALDARQLPTGNSAVCDAITGALGAQTFDDLYDGVKDGAVFAISGGDRRIEVAFDRGFTHAQIYAPLDLDALCIEPMTAPGNALVSGDGLRVIEPGEQFEAQFRIGVFSTPSDQ